MTLFIPIQIVADFIDSTLGSCVMKLHKVDGCEILINLTVDNVASQRMMIKMLQQADKKYV